MGMIQYRKWDEGDIKNIIKLTDMYISDGFYTDEYLRNILSDTDHPRIDFKVDYENRKAIPISYEMSCLGVYEEYDIENPTPQLMEKINEMLDYTDGWLDNVEAKDYEPTKRDEQLLCNPKVEER